MEKSDNMSELKREKLEEKRQYYDGWLRPDSDLKKLLERPHSEYKNATGRDDYLCEHCEGPMEVREIEYEGSVRPFVSGSRGEEPVISHKMELILYVSHRCVRAYNDECDCLGLELSYEI